MLQKLKIENFTTQSGYQLDLSLSYETFGQQLGEAPVILVNHALTGNSHVSGPDGWWNEIIGDDKCIDTRKYSILSFNIPGNGYDGFLIENYKEFVAQDVARAFLKGLELLEIESLFAIIGGSGRRNWLGNAYASAGNHRAFYSCGFRLEIYRLAYCKLPDSRTNIE